ncbi:MAG: NgoFVII family restriction endonuclease [Chloroflexia bacterium]|nr:NgoFVII family restriction endonuclease [Chloroflexia bacterium]
MPRIFDNLTVETQLLGGLRGALQGATRADFCVGYFNLRGWARLAQAIDELDGGEEPACRVLVGMQRAGREEVEQMFGFTSTQEIPDQQTLVRLRRQMAADFRDQMTIGKATNEADSGLRRLRRQILDGKVQIKLYLRHPLHAKLYLVHRSDVVTPKIGFLGSSNLTFSGLPNQGELNVDVADQDAAEKLQRWFDDRWDDRRCRGAGKDTDGDRAGAGAAARSPL